MTGQLEWSQVADILWEIVESKPEGYCYKPRSARCLYFYNGEPDCIIGHVLHRLGLTVDGEIEDVSISSMCGLDDNVTPADGFFRPSVAAVFTPEAVRLMQFVQERQDNGDSWHDAVLDGIAFMEGRL